MEEAIKKYVTEARQCLLTANYGRAYAFYLLLLKLSPSRSSEFAGGFSAAWREWSAKLCEIGRIQDLFLLYQQGCEVFTNCDKLHFYMGKALNQVGMKVEAVGMYRKALVLNEQFHDAQTALENACKGLVDGWHFAMLNDRSRNLIFQKAIRKIVCERDVVLDIGSGTGILSMLAAKHGAKKVYACEMSEAMQAIALDCIIANGMEDKIFQLNCHSTKLLLKKSTDVSSSDCLQEASTLILSETVDAGLLGEGIVDALNHAWKCLLDPCADKSRVIPHSATVYCSLIECSEIHKKHTLINYHNLNNILVTSGVGVKDPSNKHVNGDTCFTEEKYECVNTCEFEPYTSEAMKNIRHEILSEAVKVIEINFNDPQMLESIAEDGFGHVSVDHHIITSGYVDAIVLWFDLALDETPNRECVINTSVGSKNCWDQAIYPVRVYNKPGKEKEDLSYVARRLQVHKSDSVRTKFQVHTDCLFLASIKSVPSCASHNEEDQNSNVTLYDSQNYRRETMFHVTVPEEQMLRINDTYFSSMCFQLISELNFTASEAFNVLDVSNGLDLLALDLARISSVNVHKYCQTQSILDALSKVCKCSNIQRVNLHSDIPVSSDLQFDVVTSHFIEPSGLISPNALSNIYVAKTHLRSTGVVIPNSVSLVVQCVNSNELLSKCMVVSDENTLCLKIAETVNDFRVSVHSDLDMSVLAYKPLSPAETIMNLNLNDAIKLQMEKSIVVKMSTAGILHGILFWFKINIFGDNSIDTSDPLNHWKQAAYIFPPSKQINLDIEDEIVVKMTCLNDSISFSASKYGK